MKKILMAIMALFVCAGMYAQKGEQAAGINLGYGSGSLHKSFKLGLEYKYNITDAIRIAPSFDYFFKDLGTSLWDINANVHYVFNIKGNNYRLMAVIKFTIQFVYIRFIGTHKEYDKIDCANI